MTTWIIFGVVIAVAFIAGMWLAVTKPTHKHQE